MTAPIVTHLLRLPILPDRTDAQASSFDMRATVSSDGEALVRISGQLWERIRDGKRR